MAILGHATKSFTKDHVQKVGTERAGSDVGIVTSVVAVVHYGAHTVLCGTIDSYWSPSHDSKRTLQFSRILDLERIMLIVQSLNLTAKKMWHR